MTPKKKSKEKTASKTSSNQAYLVFEDTYDPQGEPSMYDGACEEGALHVGDATMVLATSPREAAKAYRGDIQGQSRLVVATVSSFTAFSTDEPEGPRPFLLVEEESYGGVSNAKG